MARTRDGFMVGPAAEFAQDTLDELAARPPTRSSSEMLCMRSDARRAGGRRACRGAHHDRSAAPGSRAPAVRARVHARARTARSRAGRGAVARLSSAMWNKALPKLNATRAATGLPALQHVFEQLAGADRILVLTSEAFDFPGGPLPPNVRYVGPRLDDPEWVEDWTPPAGDEPLVLVGHELDLPGPRRDAATGRDRTRRAARSRPRHDGTDRRAGGHRRAAERDGRQVRRRTPEVLEHAGAVVTHAGHGTVIKALAHGVPCGGDADRPRPADVAARVVASGAGLRLRPGASSDKIAAAVRRVLNEPSFAAAAGRMAESIRHDTAEDRAAHGAAGAGGRSQQGGSKLPMGV